MAQTRKTKAELLKELEDLRTRVKEEEQVCANLRQIIKELDPAAAKEPPRSKIFQAEQPQKTALEEEIHQQNEEPANMRLAAEKERMRCQDLFESAPDGYLVTDSDGLIVEANRMAETMLNVLRQNLFGKPLLNFVAEEQRTEFMTRLSGLKESGISQKWEVRIQPRGQAFFYADVTAAKIQNPSDSDNAASIRWFLHDITDRKRAEEALREFWRDLNREQSVSHTGSWRLDVRKNELRWSNETYHMFEIPVGTPLTYERFLDSVHPDDKDYVDRKWRAALRGEPYDIEHRIIVGGNIKWVRERAELDFLKDGTLLGGFGTVQDITELKQAQFQLQEIAEKYSAIFDHTSDGIWVNDLKGEILEVNDAYCQMSGYSRDELTHMPVSALEAVETLEEVNNHIRKVKASGGHDRFESRHRRKDGSIFDVDITALYYEKDGGRVAIFVRDITERKRAEDALRQSEERFRKVYENAVTGIAITDWDGRFQQCNPAYCTLLGYTEKELRRVDFRSLIHPEDRDANLAETRRLRAGEVPFFEIENRYVHKSGRIIWAHKFVSVLPDATGRPAHMVALVTDITERKRAAEALERSNRKITEILASIQDGFFTLDRDWRFVYINERAAANVGMKPQDLIGRSLWETFPGIRGTANEAHYRRAMEDREVQRFEMHGVLTGRWYNLNAYPSEEGISVYWQDISNRKQAEEQINRQRAVLDAINKLFQETLRSETEEEVARVCLDVAERLTGGAFGFIGEINDEGKLDAIAISDPGWAECKMPDLDKTKMITGMTIRGYFGRALIDGHSVIVNDPANHPDRVGVPEGHPPITSFLGVPLKRNGKTTGMIALANKPGGYTLANQQDVETLSIAFVEALERKRGYIALRESEARFQNLSKNLQETVKQKTAELLQVEHLAAVGQMVSTVAHEMRNPLHIIRTGVDALRQLPHDEKQRRESLEEIEYGCKMLAVTISELLEYAKPLTLKFSFTRLRDVVEGALKLLSDRLKNIQTNVELEQGDKDIQVDVVKFTQVLTNIISNAVDAMPNGGSLHIRSHLLKRDDRKLLEISITDTGYGIDEKYMDAIFKPFFTTKMRGTGLGLSVCKKILDAHDGAISIKSKLGEGTTVEVILPIKNR